MVYIPMFDHANILYLQLCQVPDLGEEKSEYLIKHNNVTT